MSTRTMLVIFAAPASGGTSTRARRGTYIVVDKGMASVSPRAWRGEDAGSARVS